MVTQGGDVRRETPRRKFEERAKVFTIGAAYGFVAGVFAVALIVWQFGDVGRRPAKVATEKTPAVVDHGRSRARARLRAGDDKADADSPVILAPPPAATGPTISAAPASELEDRDLVIPVEGVRPDQLARQFDDLRGGQRHEAIDILAPQGTPVKAVEDGRIARLFFSKAGGITIYQFDPSERFCYYYAHLDRYADGLRENDRIRRGQVIGYVGVSGNAPKNTPHLHFAVFRLNAEKRWWEGTPVDPYDILR